MTIAAMIIAVTSNTGQTSSSKCMARLMRKQQSASSKQDSRILVISFFGGSKHLHLLPQGFGAVMRHRIARDYNVTIDFVAPYVPARCASPCEQFQVWAIGKPLDDGELLFGLVAVILLGTEHK